MPFVYSNGEWVAPPPPASIVQVNHGAAPVAVFYIYKIMEMSSEIYVFLFITKNNETRWENDFNVFKNKTDSRIGLFYAFRIAVENELLSPPDTTRVHCPS